MVRTRPLNETRFSLIRRCLSQPHYGPLLEDWQEEHPGDAP